MAALKVWIEPAGALSAFIAAVFWFLSAAKDIPPMVAYWSGAPPDDPFFATLVGAAQLNRWAALFSGISAALLGAGWLARRA